MVLCWLFCSIVIRVNIFWAVDYLSWVEKWYDASLANKNKLLQGVLLHLIRTTVRFSHLLLITRFTADQSFSNAHVCSTTDHLSSCCLIQHIKDLSVMRAEPTGVIANRRPPDRNILLPTQNDLAQMFHQVIKSPIQHTSKKVIKLFLDLYFWLF